MSKPAKRSELAEQIELARQGINRWPEWLKGAAGVDRDDSIAPTTTQETRNAVQASVVDPED